MAEMDAAAAVAKAVNDALDKAAQAVRNASPGMRVTKYQQGRSDGMQAAERIIRAQKSGRS